MSSIAFSPQEENLKQNHGNIVFKNQGKNSRVEKIYKTFQNNKSSVDVQRARFFTQSFRETEGQALILHWAKTLYHIAENIDIYR